MTIRKAVILSAGKGSRLLPLTENRPKCLLDCSGKTLLEWQLDALFSAGVEEAVIVTGFRSDLVDALVAARPDRRARTLYNPFYHVADNTGSVWMAREEMKEDFLILNGDTLIGPDIVRKVIDNATAPITVTVDEKPAYDDDDMKVLRDGDRLLRIGKTITECNAESIGFLAFRGQGPAVFVDAVDTLMHGPEGVSSWYLKLIDQLAPLGIVSTTSIHGMEWQEVDFLPDLDAAQKLTARWREAGR
ncbi:MAG: phosphocholine cytidylyltransferase family protein [Sphingomonas sp.]|nr:phosphocholine cytidylyltransferase family protein [Sphingomonas sp.]MDX3883719.1 phosphocholine cytidylyltransferase family protein [Sphingomonas sp.]